MVLFPGEASARRRRASFNDEVDDPICYRSSYGICQKWRVELVGGGLLSTNGAAAVAGAKFGYALVLGPRLELGGNLLFVKDVRINEGPYFGTAEGVLRVATMAGPNHRAFIEFGAGASRYESSETAYWAFPCASGGVSFEIAGPGLGLFVNAGVSLMWAEGMAALPHAGVGLVF
ncbi:hypothetical protein DB31_7050 [Hyalangium minutum]|uniref:Lipoprotein n=2 Tax=Hyalangium minutum TaxID=394096 RepID=A0A085WN85_9BACT|nr:hypothetical protein DB31_7050 [Hyalangium minutum]